MVVGGIPTPDVDHAKNVADFAVVVTQAITNIMKSPLGE